MSRFVYQAVDYSGRRFRGKLEATSVESAANQLRRQGLFVHRLVPANERIWNKELPSFGGPRVKSQSFMLFCRQLATLYKGGTPITAAVRTLADQVKGKPFQSVLYRVADAMNQGQQFSEAVARYPTVFPQVFVSMAQAGEAGGNLDEMLNRLAVFYEKEHFTREKVKTALAYPAFLAATTVLVVTILMIFVVPQFEANFREMGVELPLPTRILIGLNAAFHQLWYLGPAVAIALYVGCRLIYRSAEGKYALDRWKLRLPIFGLFWRHQLIARFSRTFSALSGTGVPMLDILSITEAVVDNEAAARLVRQSRERLRRGASMVGPFEGTPLFPPMVVQMMKLGEASGSLDEAMKNTAEFYEAQVDSMSDRLKTMLEPAMILILTGIVGLIVFAIMMPSFSLIGQVQ